MTIDGFALGAVLLASVTGATGPRDLPATYRLEGTAQVSAPPTLDRRVALHADATLRAGARGELRVTIGAVGATCEVRAHADASGALRFDPGQRCAIDVRSPDARGHVDAILRAGTGRVDEERLSIDLALDVEGALALRTAPRADVLGHAVDLPATWLPEAPLRGSAHAIAAGSRDRSRAAPR